MSIALLPPLKSAELTDMRYWTADEFYQAAAAGTFDDPGRLELIHGRLQRLMQGERHANLRFRVSRRLRRAIDPPLFTWDENPLHITSDLELIADLMFTYKEEYTGRHPEPRDVALVVEIADSSVEYDLGEKAQLYARAGIADYWVVLAEASVVVIHRQPSANGYGSVARLAGADRISPLAVPGAAWAVSELLGHEEAPKED